MNNTIRVKTSPVADFTVLGLPPSPWTVPTIGTGYSDKGRRFRFTTRSKKTKIRANGRITLSLADWKKMVAISARAAMGATPPTTLPVHIALLFLLKAPRKGLIGTVPAPDVAWDAAEGVASKRTTMADLTNLAKGTEDALEGIVYANDVQVRSCQHMTLYASVPGVRVWVSSVVGVEVIECGTNFANTLSATPSKARAGRSTATPPPARARPTASGRSGRSSSSAPPSSTPA